MSTRCTAKRQDGQPCKSWAVQGSTPPLCSSHGGGKRSVGPPAGNNNARKHGYYAIPTTAPQLTGDECDIDAVVLNLFQRQIALNTYINRHFDEITVDELAHLLQIHGQNASRIGRLLRDQSVIRPGGSEALTTAINTALDELARQLETET